MRAFLLALFGFLRDLVRTRAQLLLENVFLRQQLAVLERQIKRARPEPLDRGVLAFVARFLPNWRELLRVVEPETLLRWHKKGFKVFWRWKSRGRARPRRVAEELRDLVLHMAKNNRWGAERIRGELKTRLHVLLAKRTIQRILRSLRTRRPLGQHWKTFLRNHLHQAWACDFFTVPTIFFQQLYVFFVMKLDTREILHWAVTFHPTSEWTAQQLREIMPFGEGPRFLVRDRDDKYGSKFDNVARACGTRVLLTPPRRPVANSFAERLVGTLRRECLDHMFVFGEEPLREILREFVSHYNAGRVHQGIGQRIPAEVHAPVRRPRKGRIFAKPVLNGLTHEYSRAA